ncbi:MAG: hypothetical protein VW146_05200 [Gammaproteobacteria bacterium]
MFILLTILILILSLLPIIYYVILRDQKTKLVPFLSLLIIFLGVYFLYFNETTAKSSFNEYKLLANINRDIEQDLSISPIALSDSIFKLSTDEKVVFISGLFESALLQNSLNSASSLLTYANNALQGGEYQPILLLMYANLRDKRYPELLSRSIEINSQKQGCNTLQFFGTAFLTNGPRIPLSEGLSETSKLILKQEDFVIRGFDLISATLNQESITINLDLNCENSQYLTTIELNGAELMNDDVLLDIPNNSWLKREQ